MIISIDHGNKNMKSSNNVFVSGLLESNTVPPIKANTIFYKGKYYTLSNRRIPYLRDKTEDARFYTLTLLAIGMEMDTLNVLDDGVTKEITLLTGLPPSHYGKQYKKFEEYFLKNDGKADFMYKDKHIFIHIKDVISYPQAYAAAMTEYAKIMAYSKVIVIDLGGYTLDYIFINNGLPDLSLVDSMEDGVITMYNNIISKVNSSTGVSLDETDIDNIIMEYNSMISSTNSFADINRKPKIVIDKTIQDMVYSEAEIFTNNLLGKLRERKIDMSSNMFVFVGGGSYLLKNLIELSGKIKNLLFIDDIKANVEGYKILYAAGSKE